MSASNVTLILTRAPLALFHDGAKGGRFGTMTVIVGPLIKKASFTEFEDPTLENVRDTSFTVGDTTKDLYLGMEKDGRITDQTTYDTMERYKDVGSPDARSSIFMQVKPNYKMSFDYYPLTMMYSSTVKNIYAKYGIAHDGAGLRVDKHGYVQQSNAAQGIGHGEAAGILVHMAERVGFLTGCIGPGDRQGNRMAENSSRRAMSEIFAMMGGFKPGRTARLIVLDW